MKKLLLIGAAFAVLLAPAMAAENPVRVHKRVRPVVVAAPVYTWTGFYVGGNAGYSWGTLSNNWNLFAQSIVLAGCPPAGVAFCETGSDVTRLNGALGGLQAGYNWQTGNFLAGIETDLQLANQRGSNVLNFPAQAVTGGPPPTFPAATVAYNEKLSWLGTVRARLGLTADRWVVYGTGGLAYGSVKNSGSVASSCGTGGASSFPCTVANWDDHVTKIGWTLGAGIEAAFSGAWSLKVEYLHVDFGTVNTTFAIPPNPCFFIGVTECSATVAGTGTINSRITDDIVRVGINYKFGNYATPAVYK